MKHLLSRASLTLTRIRADITNHTEAVLRKHGAYTVFSRRAVALFCGNAPRMTIELGQNGEDTHDKDGIWWCRLDSVARGGRVIAPRSRYLRRWHRRRDCPNHNDDVHRRYDAIRVDELARLLRLDRHAEGRPVRSWEHRNRSSEVPQYPRCEESTDRLRQKPRREGRLYIILINYRA